MLELVLLYLLICGAKKAWDDTKAAWGKSRRAYMKRAKKKYPSMSKGQRVAHAARHDLGYGLSQLLHGFPTARHGFAQGWSEGRQAHVKARTAREQARTGHAEAHAGALGEWQELRQRRKEALEEIRRRQAGEGSEENEGTPPAAPPVIPGEVEEPPPVAYCGYCGTPDHRQCPPHCATWTRDHPYPGREGGPTYSYGYEGSASGWPAATAEQAHRQAQYSSGDGDPWVVTEYPPGGGPGTTIATYRNGRLVQPAATGCADAGVTSRTPLRCMAHPGRHCEWVEYQDGTGEHATFPLSGETGDGPEAGQVRHNQDQEGITSMSDVTYDGVVADMNTAVSNAETRAAEVNAAMTAAEAQAQEVTEAKTRASATADQMQALKVDPATLGAMADHIDALDEAEKAHQHAQEAYEAAKKAAIRVQETAQHVSDTLVQQQGQMAEAHANTPHAAANEFFQG